MTRSPRLAAVVGSLVLAASASAQNAPLSAIDWLDDVPVEEPGASADFLLEAPVSPSGEAADVASMPLNDGGGTGTGVLPASASGFPVTLWQGATLSELVAGFDVLPADGLATTQILRQRLILASATPPLGISPEDFLRARLNLLYELGAVERALSLAEEAGPDALASPDVFPLYANAALLMDREAAACSLLTGNAALSDDLALRIFCLARNGDWTAAALSLQTGEILGDVEPAMAELLVQFLDPELADGTAPPLPSGGVSPLVARLREAIGVSLATQELPRAYAVLDLSEQTGWKAQLEAAERLVRTGAVEPERLKGLYLLRVPAASGGVWDRAAAIQALDAALASADAPAAATATALIEAHAEMQEAGLEAALARFIAPRLTEIALGDEEADALRTRLLLLSPLYESATGAAPLAIAVAQGEASGLAGETRLEETIIAAFSEPDFAGEPIALGRAILDALEMLERARAGDPGDVTTALTLLRNVGLEDIARRAALELLLTQ